MMLFLVGLSNINGKGHAAISCAAWKSIITQLKTYLEFCNKIKNLSSKKINFDLKRTGNSPSK